MKFRSFSFNNILFRSMKKETAHKHVKNGQSAINFMLIILINRYRKHPKCMDFREDYVQFFQPDLVKKQHIKVSPNKANWHIKQLLR